MTFEVKAVERFVLRLEIDAKSRHEARKKANEYITQGSFGWASQGITVTLKPKAEGNAK